MTIRSLVFAILYLSNLPLAVAGGNSVGNSGHGIFCDAWDGGFPNAGYHVLDRIVGLNATHANDFFYNGPEDPSQWVIKNLKEKMPQLGKDLERFISNAQAQLAGRQPLDKSEIWIADNLSQQIINDDLIYEEIPDACRQYNAKRNLILRQAVVRKMSNEGMVFHYDRQLFAAWLHEPLELSFILIHEWLWQTVDSTDAVRDLNIYLHGANSIELTAEDYQQGFKLKLSIRLMERGVALTADGLKQILSQSADTKLNESDAKLWQWWRSHADEAVHYLTKQHGFIFTKKWPVNTPCFEIKGGALSHPEICLGFVNNRNDAKRMVALGVARFYEVPEQKAVELADFLVRETPIVFKETDVLPPH